MSDLHLRFSISNSFIFASAVTGSTFRNVYFDAEVAALKQNLEIFLVGKKMEHSALLSVTVFFSGNKSGST